MVCVLCVMCGRSPPCILVLGIIVFFCLLSNQLALAKHKAYHINCSCSIAQKASFIMHGHAFNYPTHNRTRYSMGPYHIRIAYYLRSTLRYHGVCSYGLTGNICFLYSQSNHTGDTWTWQTLRVMRGCCGKNRMLISVGVSSISHDNISL